MKTIFDDSYIYDSGQFSAAKLRPEYCRAEVSDPPYYIRFHQCSRKKGHGKDGLFCKQHAKRYPGDQP